VSLGERLYRAAPVLVQEIGVSVFGATWRWRRFGKGFDSALREARERETFTLHQWQEYQNRRLAELLLEAFRWVPWYRQEFARRGLTDQDLAKFSVAELSRLPTVGKQDIRPSPKQFVSRRATRLYAYSSSGSTGTPLVVYMSADTQRVWQALYEARCRNWAGVHRHMRRAMIGGRLVVPEGRSGPPYGRRNWSERQLYLSAFHISRDTAPRYAKELLEFRPDYLVGYASAWFFLARFIVEEKIAVPAVKAVLTSSEKLEPGMRQTIEEAFGAPVFDAYSGVEACCLASECEHHRLHVSPDAGIVELLDGDGRPVGAGEVGEIVATGLVNFDQPLIRYRTGDMASWSEEACPCGRQMPVLKDLLGRVEDAVIGPDGRETVRFHGLWLGLPNVMEGQVVQEERDLIRLRVIGTPAFGVKERDVLIKRVRERLGDVRVVVEQVEELERTKSGKVRAVISRVSRESA
jgi:phenylacetate-CoA ligase